MVIQKQEALISLIQERSRTISEQEIEQGIDWSNRRGWWLKKIDELYDFIKPLLSDTGVSISEQSFEIHEELLGTYRTKKLLIKMGLSCFEMKPIASVIIGGVGRIDVQGPFGSARLILATPDGESEQDFFQNAVWHVTVPRRSIPLEKLDAVCFLGLFVQLMGLEE